ncbi:O-antigen ligase family protein [uncultured Clostridium sp.]|uniref:O-antigen ligase family protein n=1 Tax=uncultured Clostridium sp. TaxID=59620 RepID=UPI00259A867F|nr:O-antigen ligase family protein [uncultured Clostridium sp.]
MEIKFSKTSIYLMIELFLLYHIVFVKFPHISSYATIQRLAIIFLFLMVFPYSIRCLKKMNLSIKLLVLLYMIMILISAIINRNELIITNTLIGGIMYAITFFELFIVFSTVVEKRSIGFIVRVFLYLTVFYIVITDLAILINFNMFSNGQYFIGNKFDVAYKHLELIVLVLMNQKINVEKRRNKRRNNNIIIILIVTGMIISYLINTMTGVISIVILVVILLFFKDKLLYNSMFFVLILVGSCLVILCADTILTWNPIQNFIVNILNRDLTLTGRMTIYASIPNLIQGHLLFGYGYNTAYEVWTSYNQFMPNAQNGLINCIFEQGLIATIIIIILIKTIISKSHKSKILQKIYKPIIALLYVYAILATIEITIDVVFMGWLVLFYTITLLPDKAVKNL